MLHDRLIEELPEPWKALLAHGVTLKLSIGGLRLELPDDRIISVDGNGVTSRLRDIDACDLDRKSSQSSRDCEQKHAHLVHHQGPS